MLIMFLVVQIISTDRKLCSLRVSGITLTSQNAQGFCKHSLSHAGGLKFVARTCSRLNTSV